MKFCFNQVEIYLLRDFSKSNLSWYHSQFLFRCGKIHWTQIDLRQLSSKVPPPPHTKKFHELSIFTKLLALSNCLCIKYSHVYPLMRNLKKNFYLFFLLFQKLLSDALNNILIRITHYICQYCSVPYWIHKYHSLLFVGLWYYISLLAKFVL